MSTREKFAKYLGDRFYEYLTEHHPELAKHFKEFKIVLVEEEERFITTKKFDELIEKIEKNTNFTNS